MTQNFSGSLQFELFFFSRVCLVRTAALGVEIAKSPHSLGHFDNNHLQKGKVGPDPFQADKQIERIN